jgi:hypothetical protein
MLKFLIILFPVISLAQSQCDLLYTQRDGGQMKAEEALVCYEQTYANLSSREEKSNSLNKMSYLKFFIAEYFLREKIGTLYEAMDLAEKSVLLFGEKYSLSDYRTLSEEEINLLAIALYNYGLTTARYIDLKGVMEALSRMGDIKKSMQTIIRLKKEEIVHYGAHRTLGIFYMKVPGIAGGDMKLSKEYFDKALLMTKVKEQLSSYPANNIAFAEWLYKSGKNKEACDQLKVISSLSESEVKELNNDLFYESMIDVKKSKELITEFECQ